MTRGYLLMRDKTNAKKRAKIAVEAASVDKSPGKESATDNEKPPARDGSGPEEEDGAASA